MSIIRLKILRTWIEGNEYHAEVEKLGEVFTESKEDYEKAIENGYIEAVEPDSDLIM